MEKKGNKIISIVSLIILTVNVIILILLAVFLPFKISSSFSELYKSFKISLPIITKVALYGFPFICIVGILFLIAKERLENKLLTLIVNIIALFIFPLVLFGLYVIGVFLPLHQLGQMAK